MKKTTKIQILYFIIIFFRLHTENRRLVFCIAVRILPPPSGLLLRLENICQEYIAYIQKKIETFKKKEMKFKKKFDKLKKLEKKIKMKTQFFLCSRWQP